MTDRTELEELYREAIYEVDLPAGRVRFRVGQRLAGIEPFGLLTGYNPGAHRPDEAANRAANARLERLMSERGWRYFSGRGMSTDGTHVEPSFAVFGVGRGEVLALAREFEQAAIVWFDGERADLAWCIDDHATEPGRGT